MGGFISVSSVFPFYFLLVGWLCEWKMPGRDHVDTFLMFILFMLGCAVCLFVGVAIASFIRDIADHEIDTEPSETYGLVSLRSAAGNTGSFSRSFFLGVGTIGFDMYYFYYVSTGKDCYQQKKHLAGPGTYVYEENFDKQPRGLRVEIFRWHLKAQMGSMVCV